MTALNWVRPFFAVVVLMATSWMPSIASAQSETAKGQPASTITLGLVAKSQSNPVFQAAYAGAKDAAKELGPKYGVTVVIDWQTPADEDAQKQAEAIEQLARGGAQGIAVSCTDANTLTPAIDRAVQLGVSVMTFDSDAPRSKRMAFYGTDDETLGRKILNELAQHMNGKGTIAILAGNQTAPNLQKRASAVKDELGKFKDMKLIEDGVYYHAEVAEKAVEAVNAAQSTHPEIQGWAMVGGWPLFARNALKWNPGEVKVVAVDALPVQLAYLESGHVQTLFAQDCYGWGYKSVETLLDKIVKKTDPPSARIIDPLERVTRDNAAEYRSRWDKWLGSK